MALVAATILLVWLIAPQPPTYRWTTVGDVRFAVDACRSTVANRYPEFTQAIVYLNEGGSAAMMVWEASDPHWEACRTPELALEKTPGVPRGAVDQPTILVDRRAIVTRADGIRYATIEEKVREPDGFGVRGRTSWHVSRYFYVGSKIIVMQGIWLPDGRIDRDFRTLGIIAGTIGLAP
jgi:hypothetical protein